MYNAGDTRRPMRVVSHHEDIPERIVGFLIPVHYGKKKAIQELESSTSLVGIIFVTLMQRRVVLVPLLALLFFTLTAGSATYWYTKGVATMAAPIVVIESKSVPEPKPLHYGVQPLLSHPNFFADTRERFITDKLTFVEADLAEMRIRYYENGVELFSAPILAKGKEGSWWETPAGLYQIEDKMQDHYSSFSNAYQPWNMVFQGNFFIHGWPKDKDGMPLVSDYSAGCIRLEDADAERLFKLVSIDTPVLVHEVDFESDDFVYEPKGPELTAKHYLIADVKSNSILASSNLNARAPIASVTKLMTALVAAEHINLDNTVYVSQERYVTTLIPRLQGRNYVSMYSLLQLLLVESSNEAAEVIATQVGRGRFIELMNEKALALGLTNTTFADPSGLENDNVSTVSDLLRLVQYIHHNRSFILELTYNQNLPTAYAGGQFGELENFNVVEDDDTFIGGKIGETMAAGQTSVSLHEVDINGTERTLAFIILGSKERNDDVHRLLEYTKQQFVR